MATLRRLRITSDGTPLGERICDAETGEEVTNVLAARIELGREHAPIVWLQFADVEIDIVATEQPQHDALFGLVSEQQARRLADEFSAALRRATDEAV